MPDKPMMYPNRLIEVDLPIKRISEHARREKSIRHGHISTLHIWWARRPLAACRAVICAALWPDPADPLSPQRFRDDACRLINDFAGKAAADKNLAEHCSEEVWRKWQTLTRNGGLDPQNEDHWNILRNALLDFIADFSDWDNSTVPEYLETSRALTQSAHEALSGARGTKPLVVDPFAGGGSIPLEALRVGADAFASDHNPVAVLMNKIVLEYIPKYGQRLADEVRKWGGWVKNEAEKELAEFYPKDAEGATPIAYLWARTIRCEGPGCGVEVPLIRNMQITRDKKLWHFSLRNPKSRQIDVVVASDEKATDRPTVAGGSVTCPRPICGYTTPAKAVRAQLAAKHGGASDAHLLAVYADNAGSRVFRQPTKGDLRGVSLAKSYVRVNGMPQDEINPIRPYKNTRGLSAVTRIGIKRFANLYSPRQASTIQCLQRILARLPNSIDDNHLRSAVLATLNCAVSRFMFQNCSLSRWNAARSTIEGAFGKQALQVVWDFAEVNPLSDGPGNWNGAVDWVLKVIDSNRCLSHTGTVVRGLAQDRKLPADSAEALVTDPPYFAAIPYGDLSNVFFVWERAFYQSAFPELFSPGLVSQEDEIIVTNANLDRDGRSKDAEYYRREMVRALDSARSTVKPDGIGVIVFAESSTSSWEVMLSAIIEAGWSISGSWPIDTELQTRTQAADSASLQSSIHLVCRPREKSDSSDRTDRVGDWRDVLAELPVRIHEWMPRLRNEGVVGADAIFACLGPALQILSRYERVEKASGEHVTLKEYLEYVWAAVAKEALNMIFEGADATGLEEDARLTAMWLWTLNTGPEVGSQESEVRTEDEDEEKDSCKKGKLSGFALEYDAARKIAQGLGAHLERLTRLVEIRGETARLLPVSERARHLFGKAEREVPTKRKAKPKQLSLLDELGELEEEGGGWGEKNAPKVGSTVLDRVHQGMILFAAGRNEALKRFLVTDGAGQDRRFWHLADALCKLYPPGTEERRWIEGVMARKKGLGF
jgi:putative DNA methylase